MSILKHIAQSVVAALTRTVKVIPVPTSTVIAISPEDPFKVWVIEQAQKHKGRLTLVGGKVERPKQNLMQCIAWLLGLLAGTKTNFSEAIHAKTAREEFAQEAGGKNAQLRNVRLWAIKTDILSDARTVKLSKATDNACPSYLSELLVTAGYGCDDYVFVATVTGEPFPFDGEAKQCKLIDVRELPLTDSEAESQFGAQHDLYLHLYRLSLEGRPVDQIDLANLRELRTKLRLLLPESGRFINRANPLNGEGINVKKG